MAPKLKGNLTNVEAVALFFLAGDDKYGYEIEKIIKKYYMRRWIRVGLSSLYKTLDRLKEKKLIKVSTQKVGKMPERKVYALTSDGKKRLQLKATELLGEMEYFYHDFSLGLAMLGTLVNYQDAVGLFEKRLEACNEKRQEIEDFRKDNDVELERGPKMVIDHLVYFYKAEARWLKKSIEELEQGEG